VSEAWDDEELALELVDGDDDDDDVLDLEDGDDWGESDDE
jgi:hypothetical protein